MAGRSVIDQIVIACCGVSSLWLSQSPNFDARRWAPILGLAAQPAWLYASVVAEQWGIVALSFVYAAGWMRGLRTYWFARAST